MYQKMLNVGSGGSGGASSADKVSYDNSASGLSADNVQGAIDEVVSNSSLLARNKINGIIPDGEVNSENSVLRMGNLVQMIYASNSKNWTAGTSVGTIPYGYRPIAVKNADFYNFNNSIMVPCNIALNGTITPWNNATGGSLRVSQVYITADDFPLSDV